MTDCHDLFSGLSGAGHDALSDVDAAYFDHLSAAELFTLHALLLDLEAMRQLFTDHRDGCACGPHELDAGGYAHDAAYHALGVTREDMWSRPGLRATVEADEMLVDRISAGSDLDVEAEVYRMGMQLIFGNRARIGRLLRALPV
jgi:hypothetical protein